MDQHPTKKALPPPKRPTPPSWDTTRPYLTGTARHEPHKIPSPPLSTYPAATQHTLAVEAALHALLGMRTPLTETHPSSGYAPNLRALHNSLPELAPLLARILPLASHHATVAAFIERTRFPHPGSGFVLQAVGVALAELLAEYRHLVLRLERAAREGHLPLQKLLYLVQPSARSMAVLREVVAACEGKNGGEALDALYRLAVAHVGAEETVDTLGFVVGKAAGPLLAIMDGWIRTGVVEDPYGEFFVYEDLAYRAGGEKAALAMTSSEWEMHYTVNRENLPAFLAPFVEDVLRAGKYLNVLRGCGLEAGVGRDGGEKLYLELSGQVLLGAGASRRIGGVVEGAFARATRSLMGYLTVEADLLERLRSLRRYFLLGRGDFLTNFFDAAGDELGKKRRELSRSRLGALLEISIRTSSSKHDAFQEDVKCVLCAEDFASQIIGLGGGGGRKTGSVSGFEAFALDYSVGWPTSLIVSRMEIVKYQFIFRYLFYCRYVERELSKCWMTQARAKRRVGGGPNLFVRSFALRNRMLQFVRGLLYYTTADVLEPNWGAFERGVRRANTVDELMREHSQFLDSSVEQSLLSNEWHLRVLKNVCETCVSFAGYTERVGSIFANGGWEGVDEEVGRRNYAGTLAKFETAFDMHLGKVVEGLSVMSKKRANMHLGRLCDRLDVDGFYARSSQRSLAAYGVQ